MLFSRAHGDRHFDVEGSLILQKSKRVALGMVGGCSKDSVFFLELFVGVVQMFIDSLFRATKFPKLLVWMILKSENDQRTTHFALTIIRVV